MQLAFAALLAVESDGKAVDYRVWCALIPAAGMAAFVWDGVFISLTRSGGMLLSAFIAWTLFFIIYWITPVAWGNNRLWIAYLSFLALRGIIQTLLYNISPTR